MADDRLCLGTVQFGMQYGINDRYGKPSKQQVFTMLDHALENGINYIDTAVAYGDAEELLGEYGVNRKGLKVISKLKPNLIDDNCSNPEEVVEQEIKGSLARLRLDSLDGYLLHTPQNIYNEGIMTGLQKCKDMGLISNLGVSIYEEQHALDAAGNGLIDYIQVPYSIFDQRLDRTDFFTTARQNGVRVFARSAFLQGLIIMEDERIPDHLSLARRYLKIYDSIISKYGYSRVQAASYFH